MDDKTLRSGIDVIIPAYHPDERFRELIRRLYAQSVPPDRIFIVNTDYSLFNDELIENREKVNVFHIEKEAFDHAATRNMAVRMTKAPYFVMMTQDALPANRHLLEELIKGFEREADPEAPTAVVYARQLAAKNASEEEKYGRRFSYPPAGRTKTKKDLEELGIMTYTCSDVCAAYKRSIFTTLGGFEEPAIFNEDMVYAAKAVNSGYAVRYEAEAKVIHSHRLTPLKQLHRNFDLGVSQADHPEVFESVPSEGTGMKLVSGTVGHLLKKGKLLEIPWFMTGVVFRYAGYRLGKNYRRLPRRLVRALSASPGYWDKNCDGKKGKERHGKGSER